MADDPIAEFAAWLSGRPWRDGAQVRLRRSGLEPDDLHVESMHVARDLRGRGIGREILAKLIEICERRRILLTLEASEESESANRLQDWYDRLGFRCHDLGYGDYGPYMARRPGAPDRSD